MILFFMFLCNFKRWFSTGAYVIFQLLGCGMGTWGFIIKSTEIKAKYEA